ncbi:hypothetical protein Tco_0129959, partial [Tanacetum coccineum]
YAIDVEPIPPRNRNNREVQLDYLKHLKESVEILCEIVKEAKVERPLDRSLASACLYTKHSQELLAMPPSTRVNSCTDASRSQPRSTTKKNRISPAKSVNKKKVEEHPRTNNTCLISTNHDECVVNYLNFVNASPSINNVVRKVKQVWKPKQVRQVWKATRKVLTTVGHQWRPTGRIFTLGEQFP